MTCLGLNTHFITLLFQYPPIPLIDAALKPQKPFFFVFLRFKKRRDLPRSIYTFGNIAIPNRGGDWQHMVTPGSVLDGMEENGLQKIKGNMTVKRQLDERRKNHRIGNDVHNQDGLIQILLKKYCKKS